MNLQNGYKVLYEKVAKDKRTFLASKSGFFADAEQIGEAIEIGKYKLIYEKNGKIYCSESNVPTENDSCIEAFEELFTEIEDVNSAAVEEQAVIDDVTADPVAEVEIEDLEEEADESNLDE